MLSLDHIRLGTGLGGASVTVHLNKETDMKLTLNLAADALSLGATATGAVLAAGSATLSVCSTGLSLAAQGLAYGSDGLSWCSTQAFALAERVRPQRDAGVTLEAGA
jgi:hypothetical protein